MVLHSNGPGPSGYANPERRRLHGPLATQRSAGHSILATPIGPVPVPPLYDHDVGTLWY